MAYSTSAPPKLITDAMPGCPQLWYHQSADAAAAADADGFITNAKDIGMKAEDILMHRDTGTNIVSTHRVAAINSDGSADLADGTTVGSGTDSD